jgi:hypothetical protein
VNDRPRESPLKPDKLAEALAALEKGLTAWFKEQGIEVEGRR